MALNEDLAGVSKFLSYVLRHRPDTIGITLDRQGWADIALLIEGAAQQGRHLDKGLIILVVSTGDKRRFAISEDGMRIRALHGHSLTDVAITYSETVPPELLYHGTATRFLSSIRNRGLIAGSRQFVHLTLDKQLAMTVGQRYGASIVLTIAARLMRDQGFRFFYAENDVWLTECVPPRFILE